MNNPSHIFLPEYECLACGHWLRASKCRVNPYKSSFVQLYMKIELAAVKGCNGLMALHGHRGLHTGVSVYNSFQMIVG